MPPRTKETRRRAASEAVVVVEVHHRLVEVVRAAAVGHRVGRELGERDGALVGERVRLVEEHSRGEGAGLQRVEAGVQEAAHGEHGVEPAGAHERHGLAPVAHRDLAARPHAHGRHPGEGRAHAGRLLEVGHDEAEGGHLGRVGPIDVALPARERLDVPERRHGALGPTDDGGTELGELHPAAATLEQAPPQLLLQAREGVGDRLDRDALARGGAGEAPLAHDGAEVLELVDVHVGRGVLSACGAPDGSRGRGVWSWVRPHRSMRAWCAKMRRQVPSKRT